MSHLEKTPDTIYSQLQGAQYEFLALFFSCDLKGGATFSIRNGTEEALNSPFLVPLLSVESDHGSAMSHLVSLFNLPPKTSHLSKDCRVTAVI